MVDMFLTPDYFKDNKEEQKTLDNMKKFGGSFVKKTVELYNIADGINKMRLIYAFKSYFDTYKNWGKENKK